jgi:hypothetical protein
MPALGRRVSDRRILCALALTVVLAGCGQTYLNTTRGEAKIEELVLR